MGSNQIGSDWTSKGTGALDRGFSGEGFSLAGIACCPIWSLRPRGVTLIDWLVCAPLGKQLASANRWRLANAGSSSCQTSIQSSRRGDRPLAVLLSPRRSNRLPPMVELEPERTNSLVCRAANNESVANDELDAQPDANRLSHGGDLRRTARAPEAAGVTRPAESVPNHKSRLAQIWRSAQIDRMVLTATTCASHRIELQTTIECKLDEAVRQRGMQMPLGGRRGSR